MVSCASQMNTHRSFSTLRPNFWQNHLKAEIHNHKIKLNSHFAQDGKHTTDATVTGLLAGIFFMAKCHSCVRGMEVELRFWVFISQKSLTVTRMPLKHWMMLNTEQFIQAIKQVLQPPSTIRSCHTIQCQQPRYPITHYIFQTHSMINVQHTFTVQSLLSLIYPYLCWKGTLNSNQLTN